MAIYTPRGLKVRIAVPYAFGLMARLSPNVSPFRILKTTEGIESVPGMLAFIAGLVAFAMRLPPLEIGILVAVAQLFGSLLNLFGLYVIPGLVAFATLYSYLAGYGVYLVIVVAVGFATVGWQGLLAFFIGRLAAGLASTVLQFWQTSRYHKLTGHAFTSSEVHFFNAYRLHASRVGVTTDIDLEDSELQEEQWGPAFERFASEWPDIVRRFTVD
jgi:hypothetical protein